MASVNRKWTDGMLATEDWWAVWVGLILFGAGLLSIWGVDAVGWMAKTKTWEWTSFWSSPDFNKLLGVAHGKAGKAYEGWSGFGALFMTYLVFGTVTAIGAYYQKLDVKKFIMGFAAIFFITFASWMGGHEAHFKAAKTSQSMLQSEIYGTDVYCLTKVHKCTKAINKVLKGMEIDIAAGDVPTKEQAAQAVDKTKKAIRMSWGLQLGGGFSYILSLLVGLFIGNFLKGFAGFLKERASRVS